MHELSIALSMIDVAAEESERQGGGRVVAIHLRLGALSGVVPEALLSAWDLACESSPLEGCRLVIENAPIIIYCAACAGERPVRSIQEMSCADCGAPAIRVVSGREMEIVALELADPEPARETADVDAG